MTRIILTWGYSLVLEHVAHARVISLRDSPLLPLCCLLGIQICEADLVLEVLLILLRIQL